MGKSLTSKDLHKRFAQPLTELAAEFDALSKRWNKAFQSGQIPRPDLSLNVTMPEASVALLRKFLREASGKVDDAIAGVYRYRDSERRPASKRVGDGTDVQGSS